MNMLPIEKIVSAEPHVPDTQYCADGKLRSFAERVQNFGNDFLSRKSVSTLQINLGKRCNQACLHCHVEAGPLRTEEMSRETAGHVIALLEKSPEIEVLDITGGAPELNENFRWLVQRARGLGRDVIDRCNLTIFFEEGMSDLPRFLAMHSVRVVASLPCYSLENVDAQRGKGTFDKSIAALKILNTLGYGRPDTGLVLDLVYNPAGASLPPSQQSLEQSYRQELQEAFGIVFSSLLTLTNLPVKRFAHSLAREGQLTSYMKLLSDNFNAETLPGLMCLSMVSVSWDGKLYDCDFNQMLEMSLKATNQLKVYGQEMSIGNIEKVEALIGLQVQTGGHCLGCTAGAGSSCGGAVVS